MISMSLLRKASSIIRTTLSQDAYRELCLFLLSLIYERDIYQTYHIGSVEMYVGIEH